LLGLLCVGEGEVGAEANHAEAGGGALAATETDTLLQLAFQRGGHANDDQVRGGIQSDRDGAKHNELKKYMCVGWGYELRDEGEKKQRGFRIQDLGKNTLTEGTVRWACCFDRHFGVARADHADAEPDEIRGSSVFNGVKRNRRGGKNRGESKARGEDVKESSNERAERRMDAYAFSSRKATRQNIENARARGNGEKNGGRKEKQKSMRIKHSKILRAPNMSCKSAETEKTETRVYELHLLATKPLLRDDFVQELPDGCSVALPGVGFGRTPGVLSHS
jgi:hypothetical protein